MATEALHTHLTVGKKGEIVLPAEIRDALDIEPGEELLARVEHGRLVLESLEAVEARLLARFALIPRDVSLVDELLAERREAARREAEDMGEAL